LSAPNGSFLTFKASLGYRIQLPKLRSHPVIFLDKFYPTHTFSFKKSILSPQHPFCKDFLDNRWPLALSEVNEKMAATFAAPALKKRKERKKREKLEERISKLEEEVKMLKKQLEKQD